jgi:hypothetical protein
MTRPKPEAGDVFEHAYPFVRSTYTERDEEGATAVPCWKPGTRTEPGDTTYTFGDLSCRDTKHVADAIGAQIITVVGRFKPGRFPERIFFTRKWRDPDGKEFGKGGCRIATIGKFRSLTNGYRHPYEMARALSEAAAPSRPAGVEAGAC